MITDKLPVTLSELKFGTVFMEHENQTNNFRVSHARLYSYVFILYFLIKILTIFLLISLMPTYMERDYFTYSDIISYNKCEFSNGNTLFAMLLCGLEIKEVDTSLSILISIPITITKDFLFILIALNFLTFRMSIFYVLLLALHPYLSLYSGKLTTDLFACLAISLIYYRIHSSTQSKVQDFLSIVLCGFRNSLLLNYLIFYSYELKTRLSGKKKMARSDKFHIVLYYIMILLAMIYLCLLSPRYLNAFIEGSNNYPLSYHYFFQIYKSFWSNTWLESKALAHVFSIIVTPIFHLFFLLARSMFN